MELLSTSTAYERGAERLLKVIAAACDPRADFAERVQEALRATLLFFAADPALARLLTTEPFLGDEAATRCHQRWMRRYGALLRHAAAESPQPPFHPRFLEPALIGGIRFQIARRVLAGQADRLPQLLPDLLEFTLAFYLDPQQAVHIARASGGAER